MPKVTKKLGNNKARAWESLGFAHKKKLCQHFDTTSSFCYLLIHSSENRYTKSIPAGLAPRWLLYLK